MHFWLIRIFEGISLNWTNLKLVFVRKLTYHFHLDLSWLLYLHQNLKDKTFQLFVLLLHCYLIIMAPCFPLKFLFKLTELKMSFSPVVTVLGYLQSMVLFVVTVVHSGKKFYFSFQQQSLKITMCHSVEFAQFKRQLSIYLELLQTQAAAS